MTDRELFEITLDALDSDNPDIQLRAAIVLRKRLAQPEQESVAKYSDIVSDGKLDPRNKFDAPPQRPWVGLTDEEIHRQTILAGFNPEWGVEIGLVLSVVRNLEVRLKERNTI
jgi:hypothetical protein